MISFSYDPWGNITYIADESLDETAKAIITAICPVTYRGYNYDFTTGLYYLQSRYYNPEWGRFLNADDTEIMLANPDDVFSANMYLYCDNNPVNKVDYDGYYSARKANEYAKNGGTVLILNIKPLIERGTVQILFLSACMRANSRL